ncbi:MAG: Cas10/Cmr2 second palm domain-containing protein, partial [Candidatus Cryptobacteroides sp.]
MKEIIGASNLVEQICTKMFEPYVHEAQDAKPVIQAAGNIKCIFPRRQDCEKAVFEFKKKVLKEAPGITISQAVVEYDDSTPFPDVVEELESKLNTQRNKNTVPTLLGAIGISRSRQTGLPVVRHCNDKGPIDDSTYAKLKAQKYGSVLEDNFYGHHLDRAKIPYDIKDITDKNDWIAIIHADGNGLGQVVMKIGAKEDKFSAFSKKLNEATVSAANSAFNEVVKENGDKYPVRPIVLGGDDLTVICRADMAIPFCNRFLALFKSETKDKLGAILRDNGIFANGADYLTACAGIAFTKSSFPFYYGYNLAEKLCSDSKKVAKQGRIPAEPVPSCLMFHKVQDSFIRDYEKDIVLRELKPQNNISWKFGPYFLAGEEMKDYWSIDDLLSSADKLAELQDTGLRANLREWIGSMHRSEDEAIQRLKRMRDIVGMRSSEGYKLLDTLTTSKNRDGDAV